MSNLRSGILSDHLMTPTDRQQILRLDRELSTVRPEFDQFIFVLGNYDRGKRVYLDDFQDLANNSSISNFGAFCMDEFLASDETDVEGHLKFKVIADQADAIVPVIDDDSGGVMMELEAIREHQRFYQKAYLLKRSYPGSLSRRKYSWMQDSSLFEHLQKDGRLFEWDTSYTFEKQTKSILKSL